MGDGREGDVRVPLISCLFFLCLIIGGAFLVVYVFFPDLSQPWFVPAALLLVGFPWIFWLFMYLYACAKACIRRNSLEDRQISRRASRTIPTTTTAAAPTAATVAATSPKESQVSSPDGQRHVHFGEAVVMDGGEDRQGREDGNDRGDGGGGESSVASSRECEMPLRLSVSS